MSEAPLPAPALPRVFVDTDILVYTAERGDPERQRRCRELLRRLRSQGRAVISTQVLQEFYVVTRRKAGIDDRMAMAMFRNLRQLPTVTVTTDLIDQAIACHQSDGIAFWDALIVVAAASADCTALLSEDLNAGQALQGVRVVDPAAADALFA